MANVTHKTLNNGIEMICTELPDRHAVVTQIRFLTGTADEPADKLGVGRLVQETIDLGTEKRDGRALSDAFDEIGASDGGSIGREATSYSCLVLPEYVDRAIELEAEYLRTPTFPKDKVDVAIDLTKQEYRAMQDDAQSLADKLIGQQAYGDRLGRHSLGELNTLENITRDDLVAHWKSFYHTGRMRVAAAGAITANQLQDILEKHFADYGSPTPAGRDNYDIQFTAKRIHHEKDLEQQQIAIAFPAVPIAHDDYYVQRIMLAILSGGMSSRLFTEVREKQGLVYWVSAWGEYPRGHGVIFIGASTTPERCDTTYKTLLREVDRLSEDLTEDELERAKAGLIAKMETQGDTTRFRCRQLADDLFHHGRHIPRPDKIAKIKAVTVNDIHRYLDEHPRDRLSVVTLGPRILEGSEPASNGANGGAH